MTHEQKPESAEFRTREAQIRELCASCSYEEVATAHIIEAEARGAAEQRRKSEIEDEAEDARFADADEKSTLNALMRRHGIDREEASEELIWWQERDKRFPLNKAEQRRKDAEGAEVVAWQWYKLIPGTVHWRIVLDSEKPQNADRVTNLTPLYTRPANIAALEARVKELEGEVERLKKPEFYSFEDQENGWFDLDALMDSIEDDVTHFEPFEVNCFRSVPKIWAFCDGSKVHEFATEDEARAASAAAIREGGE